LFCDDDLLAAAAYRAARQLGIAIPAQLSIVDFNDIEIARLCLPATGVAPAGHRSYPAGRDGDR
jgi:DNA-binding LacI/PurR family transcriptional regulator